MVLEEEIVPFFTWLPQALVHWGQVLLVLAVAAIGLSYVLVAVSVGPFAAFERVGRGIWQGLADLFGMSPRRVFALAWLAVKESIHRLVLAVFVVFLVVLLFAGWYLDQNSRDIMQLYLSFVMTTTSYLVLLLALFLSVFSLPTDIAKRTIHTIVTKPVRASEIVLGRILGFATTCTVLLVVTGLFSYVFVIRGLSHTHEVVVERLTEVPAEPGDETAVVRRGQTLDAQGHRHAIEILANGEARLEPAHGHTHQVSKQTVRGKEVYVVGGPTHPARVPVYGKLSFKDRAGKASVRGINVGDEWTYRNYIEGGTNAAAIWRFSELSPELFKDGLRLELTIQVFRSHKGIIDKPVNASIVLRNPDNGLASEDIYFTAKEYYADTHVIPRTLLDHNGNSIDLFRDLVHNGDLQVEVSCLDPEQYLGMAQADVYLRAPDAPFALNFAKGFVGIWLQMLMVTGLGVMFSTFLNGSVAMLATLAVLIGGFFTKFIFDLSQGLLFGGGPTESFIRLITQANVTSELNPGLSTTVVQASDQLFTVVLRAVASVLPNFTSMSDVDFVAHGYDIPGGLLTMQAAKALAYLIPVVAVGYLFFKSREVAK